MLIEFWLYDSNFQVKIFFVWLFFFSSASLFLFRADIHLINHSYDFTRSWKLIIIHLLLFSVSVCISTDIHSSCHFAIFGPFCVRLTPEAEKFWQNDEKLSIWFLFKIDLFALKELCTLKVQSSLLLHVCDSRRLHRIQCFDCFIFNWTKR